MADREVLGDRYEIESTLGSGGMATVHRGRDRVLGRPVAIKVLSERYAGDEKFVARFRREARAAAGLNHPNVVSVFDTGDTNGRHYIVMEIVEGETLAHLLKREGTLSPERAARIARITATALQAAHDQGLIHRDVKPGNVMLTPDGDVKVMDFGIARAATDDTLTQTGMVLGTASYLSPEQSRGEAIDSRSDIYSLGCVLYEMLTGRPPFSGDTAVGVAYKHVHEPPASPSALNPAVSAELEAVVLRSLAKEPAARYPSADAFREALTAAVTGEPTEPLAETTVLPLADAEATQPFSHRRPPRRWLLAAMLGGLVLIAGILALALTGNEDPGLRGARRSPAAERTQPPESPTPEPSITESPVTSVASAYTSLQELTVQAVGAGLLDEKIGEEILKESEKAIDEYEKGEHDKAVEHLGHADEEIQVALLEGLITQETAIPLATSVQTLRAAMLAGQSADTGLDAESCEDSGPGNSACAPGQDEEED